MTFREELTKSRSLLYEGKHEEAMKILDQHVDESIDEREAIETELLRIMSYNGFAGRSQFNEVID